MQSLPLGAQQPASETLSTVLGRAQAATAQSHWAEAQALWRRVVELNPVTGSYWVELGRSASESRDYPAAIAAYQHALDLGAGPFGSHGPGTPASSAYEIARAYARLRKADSAFAWLERSTRLGMRNLRAVGSDSDFALLRQNERFKSLTGILEPGMTRVAGWRFDLHWLDQEIRRLHYAPFQRAGESKYRAAVAVLNREIPKLTDDEVRVRFMQLMAMVGDAHSELLAVKRMGDGRSITGPPFDAAPIQLFQFDNGVFVTGAGPQFAGLVGMRVRRIGRQDVNKVLSALEPFASWDNRQWLQFVVADFARRPAMLHALGLSVERDSLHLTLEDGSGAARDVTIPTDVAVSDRKWVPAPRDSAGPLYTRNRLANYWFTYLSESRTVYFQYNRVMPDPAESFGHFTDRLFAFMDHNPVDRLVLDLRWNMGGNTFMNIPFVQQLARTDGINQKGKLFVIIGRQTFSAAQNTTTLLEKWTNALFVGEPSGSNPNFIGESNFVQLPYSGLTASVSDLFWQTSWPMDHRVWTAPLLYAPPTSAAFRAGRDPAMEAILAYR